MVAASLKNKALMLLARREHSQAELQQKLSKAGFVDKDIQCCLTALQQQDWQSDQRFADCYARMRCHKGYGPLRIRAELQQKGVDAVCIANALQPLAHDWQAQLKALFARKYQSKIAKDAQLRAKQQRFFYQRGFSHQAIQRILTLEEQ